MTKEEIQQFLNIVKDGKDEEFFLSLVDNEGYMLKSIYKKNGQFFTYFNMLDQDVSIIEELADELKDDLSETVPSEIEHVYNIAGLNVPVSFSLSLNSKEEWFKLKRAEILDMFNKHLSSEFLNNAMQLVEDVDKDFKKTVSFSNYPDSSDKGILVGIVSTDEDYYWAYMTKDKEIKLSTCVGNYTLCEEESGNIEISDEEIKSILRKKFIDNKESLYVLVYCPLKF